MQKRAEIIGLRLFFSLLKNLLARIVSSIYPLKPSCKLATEGHTHERGKKQGLVGRVPPTGTQCVIALGLSVRP